VLKSKQGKLLSWVFGHPIESLTEVSTTVQKTELAPQYNAKEVESRLYQGWLEMDAFKADASSQQPPYTIVLPPPNVTGVLHIGHALTCTLEDILVRHKRMQGHNALWLPGTDHAGIATQMVVERQLQKEGVSRHDLGREKFLERVWKWKEESQTTIVSQLKMMGCSLDWSRLTFTLDESVSKAVRECFSRLYKEGLIYREQAIIQWCPRCRTALSDLEVKFKSVKGKLWSIRYVLSDDPSMSLVVATTRPETLLGDTAVAIHPQDARYNAFRGKTVKVPLGARVIPVIEDTYVDLQFGTGALKVTPAHDPNDYLLGKKHRLPSISLFDERAVFNENAGQYQGLSREKGREKILADLAAEGLLVKEEEHMHNVGHCDRCSTVVEPRVSAQWFVNAAELAKPAIEAVEKKEIRIIPEEWEKTYFEWMRNIRPWCISRQLWWGHRIPIWYCRSCGHMTTSVQDPTACEKCQNSDIYQDEDVLDTWFSSGLWPFSTLGWPNDTPDYRAFYPNQVMETGFDILFFWVARMVMLGKKMTGKFPFHTVYLHPMVRDEYGQKMSKTKGNVKDPLEIVETCGADALRFTLASMAVHGRDVLLSDARIEGYRNFVTKIWNASRFVLMHFGEVTESHVDTSHEINRWIWSRLNTTKKEVGTALEQYRFFDAANALYHFIWSDYCDWFIEFIKPEIESRKAAKESTAIQVLEEALRLLHPFMPFVTEEVWQKLPVRSEGISISRSPYPAFDPNQADASVEARVGRVCAVVDAIRSTRGENGLSSAIEIDAGIAASTDVLNALRPFEELICKLARLKSLALGVKPTGKEVVIALTHGVEAIEIRIPRGQLIDVETDKKRTLKELESAKAELERAEARLASPGFVGKAPPEVIEGAKQRKEALEKKIASLEEALRDLGAS
jgi:valyl-tRNA synthetase